MHPIAKKNFGPSGLPCIFTVDDDTGATAVGYFLRQIGSSRFIATDGSNIRTVSLAQNINDVANLAIMRPGLCTILVTPLNGSLEHIRHITNNRCSTLEGSSFGWRFGDATEILASITSPVRSPVSYHAQAVHFGGQSFMSVANLQAPNSPIGFASLWVHADDNGLNNDFSWFSENSDAPTADFFADSNAPFEWDFSLRGNGSFISSYYTDLFDVGTWNNLVVAWDTSRTDVHKIFCLYHNDVLIANPSFLGGSGDGFVVEWSLNPRLFFLASNSNNPTTVANFADSQLYVNTSIIEPDGTITEANRRNFISAAGKPVNPSTAVAAYGTPAILCSGNASTFPINQGNGGNFIFGGPSLTDAATSPSD